jgi:dTDP-4-amino-4,6-dideoxygalactose transaminase
MQFIDLKAQQVAIRHAVDAAIDRVLDHGQYILGPEINELEAQLAAFCGAKYAISCANGTDALIMGLLTKQLHAGDAVLVPTYTFAATAEAVIWAGAQPIFVDCLRDTFNMDPESLAQGIATAKRAGLRPVGIITVDLFGQPVDYKAIQEVATQHNLWIIADGAQSFGASYAEQKVGNIAEITTTSFFPAKPLGCYGDGGAIFTDDASIVEVLKSIRVHGHGTDPTQYVRLGLTGRMDTIQAAILLEKLKIFPAELKARQRLADYYSQELCRLVQTPRLLSNATSAWAQYTIVLPTTVNRLQVIENLKAAEIPTVIYYSRPVHFQPYYQQYLTATGGSLPIAEELAARVLSLPMSAYVSETDARRVVATLSEVLENALSQKPKEYEIHL